MDPVTGGLFYTSFREIKSNLNTFQLLACTY